MILSEAETRNAKVAGVIVTFHPDASDLTALITAVRPQLSQLIIVNNGSREDLPPLDADLDVYDLQENRGIAYAQNVGAKIAIDNGASHILLLDQDSIPEATMVETLMAACRDLQAGGCKVAAVGPCYMDSRQGEADVFVYRDGLKLKRRDPSKDRSIVKVDFLIASGCVIPVEALAAVGFMEDDLFIDYVDIEWGLRAGYFGWSSFGVYSANMTHSLGEKWYSFGKRKIPMHGALRHYYQFRNAIWLCRQPWISRSWQVILLTRLAKQFLFFTVVAERRLLRMKAMTLGIVHGIVGRMGRKDSI